jgi:hypothetical protein
MESRSTARRIAAVAALAVVTACQDSPDPTGPAPRADRSPVAQDRLEAVFQRVSPQVMALPGTVFSDNDEAIGKVVIGVDNMGAARGVQQAMARLGVAESDYAVELTSPIEFKATLQNTRFTTGRAGMQVHFSQYVCSVGANVTHVATGASGFIINSHCTATQGGTEGTLYYQPNRTAFPTAIAIEVDDPAYFKGGVCPRGKKCRYSDASRATFQNGYTGNGSAIAKTTAASPNTGSLEVDPAGGWAYSGQDDTGADNVVGVTVNKVGRTTGWTQGRITRTCTNTSVSGSTVYQICQTFVSDPNGGNVVGSGDSGSGVWTGTGTSAKLVGLLWGGSSDNKTFIFSPLKQVQQELGAVDATP